MTRQYRGIGTVCVLLVLAIALGGIHSARSQTKAVAADIVAAKATGSKSAPITIEVFSDFECPACRALYMDTIRQVMDDYAASGKVYLIHRDFPLPMHKYSRVAARYANAAARIGKFERVEEALYTKQPNWSADGNVDAVVAGVLTPAEMTKVRQLVKGGQLDSAIEKDVALGNGYRVMQTPTTVIMHNGQTYPIVGVVSYPILRRFLDDLLRQ